MVSLGNLEYFLLYLISVIKIKQYYPQHNTSQDYNLCIQFISHISRCQEDLLFEVINILPNYPDCLPADRANKL